MTERKPINPHKRRTSMPHPRNALLWPLLVAGVLAACFGSDDPQTERARRARANGKEVVIGAAWPWEARKNVMYWQGIEMAVAETNAEGGVLGRSLRVVRADDQESVDQGRSIAQEFGKNPDVVAVIGHLQSYVTVPAAAIYDLSGLVLVSATSTTSELTGRGYRRTFRTIFTDVEVGRQMADFALRRGYRRMVIYYARDENGRGLANAFEEHVASNNLQILDRQSYDPNQSATARMAEQAVEAWKNLNVDAVFIAGQDEPAAKLAAELRRRGIGAAILGGDALATPSFLQIAGKAAEGAIIGTPFHSEMPAPEAQRFAGAFRKRYGREPDVGAALGYDAVRVLVQGMRKAPSVHPDDIAAALHGTRGWQGVTGRFTFDESGGLVDMPIQKVVVRDGAFHYLPDPAPAR
jgi:branched-chain amino acid transport system substrate-binding protein